ncbi:MAG: arginase, partial [Planctomycetota bacterium]
DVAKDAKDRGSLPVFLGGDHSIAAGTIAGVASHFKAKNEKLGLIWFDAHTDMNTPATSPSGNVHGMPLASLLGYGSEALNAVGGDEPAIDASNVYVIGARDVDENEKKMVVKSGINVFSMKEVDSLGMAEVSRLAIEGASKGTAGIHLSFDIDGLDPMVAPGVGTPVRGGINFREAHLLMELISDSQLLTSVDIVELNPVEDVRNQTADAVVHLMQSVFGRRIL